MTRAETLRAYEDKTRLMPGAPIIARLDGKSFHTWTKGLDKPFDENLSNTMIQTTRYLAEETNALVGYTQSDEISLTWYPQGESEVIFGGKVQKMASVLASMCTSYFNGFHWVSSDELAYLPPEFFLKPAFFDCRVYAVPTPEEGAEVFDWRMEDAVKNSISAAAQAYFSPAQLHGQNSSAKILMLQEKGILWQDYPRFFREGTFIKRVTVTRAFTTEEIEKLPPKHAARLNPDLTFERHDYKILVPEGNLTEWIYG